jgi:hypothetical protein
MIKFWFIITFQTNSVVVKENILYFSVWNCWDMSYNRLWSILVLYALGIDDYSIDEFHVLWTELLIKSK